MTKKEKSKNRLEKNTKKTLKKKVENKAGNFEPVYKQFKNKPKLAIKHLLKVKQGECLQALYRNDIGFVDIVWGEHDDKTGKGFGLKHIYRKHGDEIKQLGFSIEDFIPIVVLGISETKEEYLLESNMFRVVIERKYNGRQKQWLLTAFDLRKKPLLKTKALKKRNN
ncbi:MAG: hypothetical protein PHP52_13545 [Bacteroidales bacterium]|nr:hypothetical protein [Bacteroidales bacterium]MDD4216928.1 hypothetical protein [Bacteroidales bacterium]MDY0141229.1 hypothetical protein [Bacteroidales bacterium]